MLHVVADTPNLRCEMHYDVGSVADFGAGLRIGQISLLKLNLVLDSFQVAL